MDNIFLDISDHKKFEWKNLGDIRDGRGDLGEEMPVLVYRLMQYTMIDVLSEELGLQKANEFFRSAGRLAGIEFTQNCLDTSLDFNNFIAELQAALKDLKIGVLRMEQYNPETGEITLTVGEDLDCSGLPITNENVCVYDEGFIAGILELYTGKPYLVNEIDCWASGNRTCRFKGAPSSN